MSNNSGLIGVGVNIWTDTVGTGQGGGGNPPSVGLLDRFNAQIIDRAGDDLETRVASN